MNGINRLEDFLKLTTEEAVRYDFSMEKASANYCDATPIKKYILYKSFTIYKNYRNGFEQGRWLVEKVHEGYTDIIDPDSGSELLQVIYQKLWPDLYREGEKKLCSDTMTSVQYTMNECFKRYIESLEEKANRGTKQVSIRYMIDLWARSGSSLEECIEKSVSCLEKIQKIEAFLGAWHTIGNYCPVPSGFNDPRSNFGRHDFWDLTLMKIKEWYCCEDIKSEYDRQSLIRHELFHNNVQADVLNCINWLRQFGTGMIGWCHFINYFYLQDWVDAERNYEVKPLWKNHSWDNLALPKEKKDMEEFFVEYENRTQSRGKKIFCALKGETF